MRCRACVEGRHPVTQIPDGDGPLTYGEMLMVGLPQFLLSLWELRLNGWSSLTPDDSVSRLLLDLRERQPVGAYRMRLTPRLSKRRLLRESLKSIRLCGSHWRRSANDTHGITRRTLGAGSAFSSSGIMHSTLWRCCNARRNDGPKARSSRLSGLRHDRWRHAAEKRLLDLMGAIRR